MTFQFNDPFLDEGYGIQSVDVTAEGLLVHAPLDQVAAALAQPEGQWQQDVYGYGQSLPGLGLIVFQLQDHEWTEVVGRYAAMSLTNEPEEMFGDFGPPNPDWEELSQSLTTQLQTRSIHFWLSDLDDTLGYTYWVNGTLMERMEFGEWDFRENDEDETADEETQLDENVEEDESGNQWKPWVFESQLRQLTASEIEDAHDFMYDFLCEQKAYVATYLVPACFQRDDFIRVDYVPSTEEHSEASAQSSQS